MKKEVRKAEEYIKKVEYKLERYNMKNIVNQSYIWKDIRNNNSFANEEEKIRFEYVDYMIKSMTNYINSIVWLEDWRLRRTARVYLRNLDINEVSRECGISYKTAYNHIFMINTILTSKFIQLGLPTLEELMLEYYR